MLDGEKELLKQAIMGEASAFSLLYKHYQPKIYRFIFLKVGYREEAEDLTHLVFISAWHNIENYQFQGFPFSAWLYKIARNKVIDYYRSRKDKTIPLEAVAEELHSPADDSFIKTEDKLALDLIKEAILKLKPEYQEIIILRFIEDMTLKEAALAMEKSEGAIKLLQHRAIKNLKKLING